MASGINFDVNLVKSFIGGKLGFSKELVDTVGAFIPVCISTKINNLNWSTKKSGTEMNSKLIPDYLITSSPSLST